MLLVLPLHLVVDPLETNTALNGANSKARAVVVARDSPCLPFKGRREVLVQLCGLIQIINTNVTLSSPNNQQILRDIH